MDKEEYKKEGPMKELSVKVKIKKTEQNID